MKLTRRVIVLVLTTAVLPALAQQARAPKGRASAVQSRGQAGPHKVATATYDWTDPKRKRDVPARIYYPAAAKRPAPVIIFSHGLGGSRDMYQYLGAHWADWGYVSLHLQHKGSDSDVWKGTMRPLTALRKAAADPTNAINRPLDVTFAIDQLVKLNAADGPMKGRMDLARIGAAGHSFGAFTTLALAGEVFILPGGKEVTMVDRRIKAAISMSAPVPATKEQLDKAFGSITIPCMHMTGTKDDSRIGKTTAAQRRLPYDHSRRGDRYLIIFSGGDHMIFSGRTRWYGTSKTDQRFHHLIKASTVLFWDAYLSGDAQAKHLLSGGPVKTALGSSATLELTLDKPISR